MRAAITMMVIRHEAREKKEQKGNETTSAQKVYKNKTHFSQK
jgi:hypothetical protein